MFPIRFCVDQAALLAVSWSDQCKKFRLRLGLDMHSRTLSKSRASAVLAVPSR